MSNLVYRLAILDYLDQSLTSGGGCQSERDTARYSEDMVNDANEELISQILMTIKNY